MEKEMNILFGFDNPTAEDYIVNELKNLGVTVNCQVKSTKNTITSFLQSRPEFDTVILLEVMNKSRDIRIARWTAEEIASLTDDRDMNIIVILDESKKGESHIGTPFMQTLYCANILNAVYQGGKGNNHVLKDVLSLLIKPRTRKEARDYYGISDYVEIDFLSNQEFRSLYKRLYDEKIGNTPGERFAVLCQKLNNEQIADFIRRLPASIKEELETTEDYRRFKEFVRYEAIPIVSAGIIEKQTKRKGVEERKSFPALVKPRKKEKTEKAEELGEQLYLDKESEYEEGIDNVLSDEVPGEVTNDEVPDKTSKEEMKEGGNEVLGSEPVKPEAPEKKKRFKWGTVLKAVIICILVADVIMGLYISNAFSFLGNFF